MMMEPRSTATIRALAGLAELSANQLEEGVSIDEVIATLRKAAEAVRLVVDTDESDFDEDADLDEDDADIVQDLTPVEFSATDDTTSATDESSEEQTVLIAG
ncbi:hypothetical protein FMN50_17930 [Rhodobacterales bacterium]|nr:hypothetical protein FMN50_17930 [Rhodobacterales bacterium]